LLSHFHGLVDWFGIERIEEVWRRK